MVKEVVIDKDFESEISGLKADEKPQVYNSFHVVLAACSAAPNGCSFDEIATRLSLLRKIKDTAKVGAKKVILENSEFDQLVNCLKAHKFGVFDPAFHTFIQEIINTPEAVIEVVKPPEAKANKK